MNEHSFIKSVHGKLPATSDSFLKWKVNARFADGVGDAYYVAPDHCLWVEYKYIPVYPKRAGTVIWKGLEGMQKVWLTRMAKMGHSTAAIVGCENDAIIVPNWFDWEREWTTAEFMERRVPRKDIAPWIMKQLGLGVVGS
jgi:hypothetical protein